MYITLMLSVCHHALRGMPVTLIECFAVGAIPVCTPVGGIVNVIRDGEKWYSFFIY